MGFCDGIGSTSSHVTLRTRGQFKSFPTQAQYNVLGYKVSLVARMWGGGGADIPMLMERLFLFRGLGKPDYRYSPIAFSQSRMLNNGLILEACCIGFINSKFVSYTYCMYLRVGVTPRLLSPQYRVIRIIHTGRHPTRPDRLGVAR